MPQGTRLLTRRLGHLYIEAIPDADRRKVNYYRYTPAPGTQALGAVSLKADGWRALAYGLEPGKPHRDRVELGRHPTRSAAEAALLRHLTRLRLVRA